MRRDSSLKARAIVDPINVGPIVAQLLLQRALLFRNTYTFKLGWKYCLLEPMDLVQITDARLGASALTVRITAVEEDEEGTLSITAEDFFGGYSTAVLYPKQSGAGYVPNWNSTSGRRQSADHFRASSRTTDRWTGNLGCAFGGADWGGAQVWISSDGNSYALAGTVNSSAPQGVLTADLPAHSSPDATNPLAVDLTESRGQLASVSTTDAANLVTLCYVGGELLAYQTATLTAAGKYTLTTLYRGAYGSTIIDHPPGTSFARLDGSIGRFSYPNNLIGQTIFLKFASMNIVGGGLQSLASLPAYTYLVRGTGQASSIVVSGSFNGRPTANLVLQSYVFAAPVTIPAGFSGSRGYRCDSCNRDNDIQHSEERHECRNNGFRRIGCHGHIHDEFSDFIQCRRRADCGSARHTRRDAGKSRMDHHGNYAMKLESWHSTEDKRRWKIVRTDNYYRRGGGDHHG